MTARILVADDDAGFRHVIRRMLEGAGYEVEEAENGDAAMVAYRARPADLILMDVYMPGADGVEAMVRLRQEFPNLRVVAVSGGGFLDREHVLDLAQRLGADRTLTKPVNKKILLTALNEVLTNSGG
jgi:CheY-like chemotaxis protein